MVENSLAGANAYLKRSRGDHALVYNFTTCNTTLSIAKSFIYNAKPRSLETKESKTIMPLPKVRRYVSAYVSKRNGISRTPQA